MRRWILAACALFPAAGQAMSLTSPDLAEGAKLGRAQIHSECGGSDLAPRLSWSGAPAGTMSFAVTMYDPDARGGWWHWIAYNIPPNARGIGGSAAPPKGTLTGENDFGAKAYGGACPPPGSGPHHYRFTVWAMGTAVLPLEGATEDKMIGAYIEGHALASATITATYER